MSVRVMSAVFDHSASEGTTFLVLLVIADHANSDGLCWPTVERIAIRARLSRATVFRAVTELEEIGELKRETGGGGRHRPNVYRVMPDHVDNSEEGSQAETGKGLRLRQKGLTPGTRKGLTVATQNHQNRKEPRATFNSAIPDDFDPDISGHVADIRAGLRKGPK